MSWILGKMKTFLSGLFLIFTVCTNNNAFSATAFSDDVLVKHFVKLTNRELFIETGRNYETADLTFDKSKRTYPVKIFYHEIRR